MYNRIFRLPKNRILPILVLDRQCHPLLCSSVLGPRAALRSCTEISSGGIVRDQSGAAPERKIIVSAYRGRTPIVPNHRRTGNKKSGAIKQRIKKSTLKRADRTPPINHNDSGGADSTKSSRKADLAFQRAMWQAIAQGLERPPGICVVKDPRPLYDPHLFDPVPYSSGCTSPALECAELVARND